MILHLTCKYIRENTWRKQITINTRQSKFYLLSINNYLQESFGLV